MSKKLVIILTVFILVTSFSGCGKYEAPISSKTYDIKSFRIEDGKKISIDSIFSKTVFEYENEPENKIDFVEWKPRPLTAKGELEISWVKYNFFNYSDNDIHMKNYKYFINFDRYYCESKIDGWKIIMFDNEKLLLDPFSGVIKQAEDYVEYVDYDSINGLNIYFSIYNKVYRCRNRITKEIISTKYYHPKEDGIPLLFPNQLFLYNGQEDILSKRSFSDFRKYWSLKLKLNSKYIDKEYIIKKSQDILWFIFSDKDNKSIIGYDLINEIAYEFIVSEISGIFTNQESLFLINNNYKVYKLDIDTLEFSSFIDLSNIVENKVENNFYTAFTFYDIAFIQYKNNKVLLNLKTKNILQTDLSIGISNNNIYLYDDNNNNVWGIDHDTLKNTWHINTSDYSKNNKVILIDERGALIQDEDMLYTFRPKK